VVCRSGVMLSCRDAGETGRSRLAGRSPDSVIDEGSRVRLPVCRCGTRTAGLESIPLFSVRSWPAPGWVGSVVIAMTGSQRAGAGCPRNRVNHNMDLRLTRADNEKRGASFHPGLPSLWCKGRSLQNRARQRSGHSLNCNSTNASARETIKTEERTGIQSRPCQQPFFGQLERVRCRFKKHHKQKMPCLTVILAAPIVWNPLFEGYVFSFGKRASG